MKATNEPATGRHSAILSQPEFRMMGEGAIARSEVMYEGGEGVVTSCSSTYDYLVALKNLLALCPGRKKEYPSGRISTEFHIETFW